MQRKTSTGQLYQSLNSVKKPLINEVHDSYQRSTNIIRIDTSDSLYDALGDLGYLRLPSFPTGLGLHLVGEGQLGLVMDNGTPVFLAGPGRYTLWSPLAKFKDVVSISDQQIKLGPIDIHTVAQDEIAVCCENGEYHLLKPGRYILKAPCVFITSEKANKSYINIKNFHCLSVPKNVVAIVSDNGQQSIISAEDTKDGPYMTTSPTFSFNPTTGFQYIKTQVVDLDELNVNTTEAMAIKVKGVITYRIDDPHIAFLEVADVHEAIKKLAESTLTSVFAGLTVDKISSSLSTSTAVSLKDKNKGKENEPGPLDYESLIHYVTHAFLEALRDAVSTLGVNLITLNLESMVYQKEFADSLRKRAQTRMDTDTQLITVDANNEVARKEAMLRKEQTIIAAEGEAQAIERLATAKAFAAQKKLEAAQTLGQHPLAEKLALMEAQTEMCKALGDKTLIPHGFSVGSYGLSQVQGQMLYGSTLSSTSTSMPITDYTASTSTRLTRSTED